jgi:hypothetical protein
MQQSVAQLAALVVHGNAFLQGFSGQTPVDLQASNSAFRFCEWVRFADSEGYLLSKDVAAWFVELKKSGAHGLTIRHESSARGLANIIREFVSGGGSWAIEETRPDGCYHWTGYWKMGERGRSDRRIWWVTYRRNPITPCSREGEYDLAQTKDALKRVLQEGARFMRSVSLGPGAECFDRGLKRLESQTPLLDHHHYELVPSDIVPNEFVSLDAEQLLGATLDVWEFGGTGLWTDHDIPGESDRAQYRQIAEGLYPLLNRAVVAAANSSARKAD